MIYRIVMQHVSWIRPTALTHRPFEAYVQEASCIQCLRIRCSLNCRSRTQLTSSIIAFGRTLVSQQCGTPSQAVCEPVFQSQWPELSACGKQLKRIAKDLAQNKVATINFPYYRGRISCFLLGGCSWSGRSAHNFQEHLSPRSLS